MKFQDKLKKAAREDIWSEYCGFLDLSLSEYMFIQRRLMQEQIRLWCASGIGRLICRDRVPDTLDEFREIMPLTGYEDYEEPLLLKRSALLPVQPVTWVQTTWEGGLRPLKLVPYTKGMLDSLRHNLLSVLILSAAGEKGDIRVKSGDRIIYGGAPLPYATGLLPSILSEEISFTWLPETTDESPASFSRRSKKGFEMALGGGVDFFISIGNIASYITGSFSSEINRLKPLGSSPFGVSPISGLKYLKAKYLVKRDGKGLQPRDFFSPKGIICSSSDIKNYKEILENGWGVRPIDFSFNTESSCIGTESWERQGMCFFPDTCFYEFIPEAEMNKNINDPEYMPRTCLMDEVSTGENYELVVSVFHGGVFMRYRVGDMYRCVYAGGDSLPRFSYIDRVPGIIDIAGFSHLTRDSIEEVFRISKLGVGQWLAKKEYDEAGYPFLHIYMEILPDSQELDVVKKSTLSEHFSVYFKYYDSDYGDLRQLINSDPLKITVLKYGSIDRYCSHTGRAIPRINPSSIDIAELMRFQTKSRAGIREEAEAI